MEYEYDNHPAERARILYKMLRKKEKEMLKNLCDHIADSSVDLDLQTQIRLKIYEPFIK